MADQQDVEERATFVVRLWRAGRAAPWRGQVEYVQLGEQTAAPDVRGVLRQITDWIAKIPGRAEEKTDA
jgi:hypothetical protein